MKKAASEAVLVFLLVSTAVFGMNLQLAKAEPTTIYVDDDNTTGPWNGTLAYPYQNITSALEHVQAGDTVFTFNGIYNEDFEVEKRISLVGEDRDATIIDGQGLSAVSLIRLGDGASNTAITNFTIRNGQRAISRCQLWKGNPDPGLLGIEITQVNITAVEKNGIALHDVNWCHILRTHFEDCGESGIELVRGGECTIYHNTFVNNSEHAGDFFGSSNSWDNGYPGGGNYWDDHSTRDLKHGPNQDQPGGDGIVDTRYQQSGDPDVYDNYPLRHPWTPPDIAVTNVTTSKTVVGEGYTVNITATLENQNSRVEGVDIEVYANNSIVGSEYAIVRPKILAGTLDVTLVWNTSGWSKGNYNISSYAVPSTCEQDVSDNRFEDGWLLVTIPGDVDGDRDVDIFDIITIVGALGSQEGDPNYDPNCDIDSDGDVDQTDLGIAQSNYGKSW